jgi:hypothetical protein
VPEEFLAAALFDLERQFGAVSCETQTIHGFWQNQGESFRDPLVRVFADVEDTPVNRQFFIQFKERLKTRFQQHEIWMTTYLVEII